MTTTFKDRLIEARTEAQLSQAKLAKLAKCGQTTIANMEIGRTSGSKIVPRLAEILGVNVLWLAEGRGPKKTSSDADALPRPASKDDYALIPQYSAKGACGNGHHNDHVEVVGGLAFKRDWISRMSLKEDSLCVIYAHGESMNPTINDGDVLLVNAEYGSLRSGKVYAIRSAAGELLVKRLGQDALGNWLICSDNPDKDTYPNARVTPSEIDEIQVIGQVVWKGGGL